MTVVEKAFFRRCPIEERKKFKQSQCFMPISIGQKVHEGIKLQSTLTLVNRSFKGCVILIDDLIQRHTMKIENIETSMDALLKITEQEGDEWIQRNSPILKKLEIPYKIIRWKKWLYHPEFQKKKSIISQLYQEDDTFKKAVTDSINNFLERYKKRNEDLDESYAFACCLEYLIEECSCMCLWPEEQCEYELYPSGRNLAMIETYEKLIQPVYPNLMISVSLYFKKTGSEVVV